MPKRRAPRNFLLTPKMVGIKPPLPRAYPIFRFATVVATLLFAFSFLNIRPIPLGASAPMPEYGIGGGGADATEAPMAEMAVVTEAPVAAPEPASTQMALAATATPEPLADQNRAMEEPASPKSAGETVPASPRPLLTPWQMTFGILALLGAASMFLIQHLATRKWR